jgi:hypothetical protein
MVTRIQKVFIPSTMGYVGESYGLVFSAGLAPYLGKPVQPRMVTRIQKVFIPSTMGYVEESCGLLLS